MKLKNTILFYSLVVLLFTSCKLTQESKLYSDKSSSSEITLRLDPSLAQKMNAAASKDSSKKIHGKSIKELPTDWVSFYDLGLYDSLKMKVPTNSDTAAMLLKSMYIKYMVENGQFVGFGMKAERLKGTDMLEFSKHFNQLNPGKAIDSMRPANTYDPITDWDGKTLTLKFKDAKKSDKEKDTKKKSEKGKGKSNDMFTSMFKDANIMMTYRFSFEKKIMKIKGKHDLLKKIDDYTVVFEIDFKKIMELSEKGKSLRKADPLIIIETK